MQHNLLKKYENEVNDNAVKQDLINHMKIELDQLAEKSQQQAIENAEHVKRLGQLDELELNFKSLLLDYESCKIKCKKYKRELECFDEKFFDELEDLKYNFSEAVKLNKHYEKILFELKKNDTNKSGKHRVKFALDFSGDEKNLSESDNEEALDESSMQTLDYQDLIQKLCE